MSEISNDVGNLVGNFYSYNFHSYRYHHQIYYGILVFSEKLCRLRLLETLNRLIVIETGGRAHTTKQ